jgi:hypothetical protein
MGKTKAIQTAIVIAVLVIVLPLALTSNHSYSGSQSINWDNASKALTFNLQTGQTVNGWINYTGEKSGAWYLIGDPNGNEIGSRTTDGNFGNFAFTATVNGEYFIDIWYDKPFGITFNYSYTVSSVFLWLSYIVWIGLVIVVGIFLELIITLISFYHKKKSKVAIG